MADATCTEDELRLAFKISGLWREGWTYQRAVHTVSVFVGLRATATAMRNKYQQQHGKPAPVQRALI